MLVLIGCSPSSGSSFLADLLDSVPGSLCGAELGLFSNKYFYDYSVFAKNPFCGSPSSSIYWLRNSLYRNSLNHYGLDHDNVRKFAKKAGSPQEFSELILETFEKYRKEKDTVIWFEKTPLNSNCIGEFLDEFTHCKFIYLVRNPAYVYVSLLKRNYSNLISAANWLVETANYYRYRNNPNVLLIRYEDLVKEPFNTVSDLLFKLTRYKIDIEEVKHNYESNNYRESLGRQKSWNINSYGHIGDANAYDIPIQLLEKFSSAMKCKLTKNFSELFSLAEISFRDAVQETGYENAIEDMMEMCNSGNPGYSSRDNIRLFRKWVTDALYGDCGIDTIKTYLHPLEISK